MPCVTKGAPAIVTPRTPAQLHRPTQTYSFGVKATIRVEFGYCLEGDQVQYGKFRARSAVRPLQ